MNRRFYVKEGRKEGIKWHRLNSEPVPVSEKHLKIIIFFKGQTREEIATKLKSETISLGL